MIVVHAICSLYLPHVFSLVSQNAYAVVLMMHLPLLISCHVLLSIRCYVWIRTLIYTLHIVSLDSLLRVGHGFSV